MLPTWGISWSDWGLRRRSQWAAESPRRGLRCQSQQCVILASNDPNQIWPNKTSIVPKTAGGCFGTAGNTDACTSFNLQADASTNRSGRAAQILPPAKLIIETATPTSWNVSGSGRGKMPQEYLRDSLSLSMRSS